MYRSVIAGVAVVALVACSGGSDADSPPTSGEPSDPATTAAADADGPGDTTTTTDGVDQDAGDPAADDEEPPGTDAAVSPTVDVESDGDPPTTDTEPDPGDESDRPFVINGPATVTDDAEGNEPTDDEAPTGRCAGVARGVGEFVLEGGGVAHDVRVFVPELLLAEPAPVVLDWHGLGSNGVEQAVYSGYEDLAAAEGFITVHATGAAVGVDDRNSWELTAFDGPERDDLAFVDVLIDTIVADWCGDPDRVYSTGMSNGGFFTAELVCFRADRIAGAVSVAGLTHPPGCEPSRAVPYLAFHGTDDEVVPFDGDAESTLVAPGDPGAEFFTQVMPDEFAEFAVDAGCEPSPTRVEVTPEVVRYDYVGCRDDTPMSFYELPGSGHTWPGSPIAELLGGAAGFHTDDVSATEAGWEFFAQHSL